MNLTNNSFRELNICVSQPLRISSFLFLQGPACRFFSRLAVALRHRGHLVSRINFNGGDRAFWRLPGAVDYLGDIENFSAFVAGQFAERSVTDLVLLGDCRPLHKLAIEAARFSGITTHIFEEGYVRPNWITLEQSGVNGFSSLPRDLDSFLLAASRLPPVPSPAEIPACFPYRALDDVIYSAATVLMSWRYRGYKRHWPYGQFTEYLHGGRRLFARMAGRRRRARAIATLLTSGVPYYVFPMQVDVDSQIIFHSQFNGQADVTKLILASFANNAPKTSILVITEHPLETSPANWRKLITELSGCLGIAARIRFFSGGSPLELLAGSRGIVVVNSTTGHQGLELGVPVIALSRAVFNLAGISFQGGLDEFWKAARPADAEPVQAYRKVVIHRTQLNGGFFSDKGIALAVANAVPAIEATNDGSAPARNASSLKGPARPLVLQALIDHPVD